MVEGERYAKEAALQYALFSNGGAMGESPRDIGSVLEGKYEIVRPLGAGGMGEVYLVRHLHLQELRVVKILRQDLATDPVAQARFLREARLATQIKHPNVAILYDYSRLGDGSFYMVWEYIEGQDVGDRLRREGPFPVAVAVQLGIQTLRGLEAIHSTGVIHRDLSPDNLMITEDRRGQLRVKIIDLGLARDPGPDPNLEITKAGMFMGKLQYCSPEQAGPGANEAGLDRRSDIYSFALVLYEMICGRPPFDSESPHGFIFKRLSEDPLPLSGRNPEIPVPAELDRVVRRALEREREQRFPDAVSFILALEKVGHGLNPAATQEIQIPAMMTGAPPARPAQAAAVQKPRSSSELTREERMELLAQIEKAAARAREGDQVLARARDAIAAGRLVQAAEMVHKLEATNPQTPGLEAVRQSLAEAEAKDQLGANVRETERVLEGYLAKSQLALARFALESLLEQMPNYPRRSELESRISALAEEIERDRRISDVLEQGRAALSRGDLRTARGQVEIVRRIGGSAEQVAPLEEAIVEAEREDRNSIDVAVRRRRLETLLANRKIAEAERELADLGRLDVPRVTLDAYRERIDAARATLGTEARSAELARRAGDAIVAKDFLAARSAAQELSRLAEGGERGAQLLTEIDRAETTHRRQESIEQGVRQVEAFLAQGQGPSAELALKILVQMDPENRHRKRLEKQLKALAG
ncbi:MAG TPA: protein kinase [Thermoanaerobaculia bacterium]|nr:protein kinase [Thermoanaerobaculia bacterium]